MVGTTGIDGRKTVSVSNDWSRCGTPAITTAGDSTARWWATAAVIVVPSPSQVLKPGADFWCIGHIASFLQQVGRDEVVFRPQFAVVPRIAPLRRSVQRIATETRYAVTRAILMP